MDSSPCEAAKQQGKAGQGDHRRHNRDYPWDVFDSEWYARQNFAVLRDDDRRIVETVRDLFGAHDFQRPIAGIDVGSGPNLYPALAMLPFCDTITLWEYADSNLRWLEQELPSYSPLWDRYWQLLERHPRYRAVEDPRGRLAAKATVHQGTIFGLPERQWDMGTMFFVAESISAQRHEFLSAVTSFVRSLRPKAPFAAAFMANSQGYAVGQRRFPAVAVSEGDVRASLAWATEELDILRIGVTGSPLRDGYSGMILATGRISELAW